MDVEEHKRFRRRRAFAGLGLLALLALLITAIDSHGGGHRAKPRPVARHVNVPQLSPAEQEALTHRAEEKAIDSVLAYTPAVRAEARATRWRSPLTTAPARIPSAWWPP